MAYYPNNAVSGATTVPHANRAQELPARAQRTNQVQYVEERLRNGLSPLAVAGVAALLTQLDSMQTLPGVSVSLVTEVAGYRRTLTSQNNAWEGHDLTHRFLDERSTTMLGPSQGTRFEQEASLCMVPASVATVPPPPLVPPPPMIALPPPAPNSVPMTPTIQVRLPSGPRIERRIWYCKPSLMHQSPIGSPRGPGCHPYPTQS